jgi:pyruvate-formate lyase-activating enzyme
MVDIGACAKRSGLLSLVHSNGFINPDPLQNLCTALDAANIDLKGFTETFYSELCGGELGPVHGDFLQRVMWRGAGARAQDPESSKGVDHPPGDHKPCDPFEE